MERRHEGLHALLRQRPLAFPTARAGGCIGAGAAQAGHPGLNGKIGFERPDKTGADLFSVGADGSDVAQLTDTKGLATEIAFSPDGQKIACSFSPEEGKPFEATSPTPTEQPAQAVPSEG